MEIVYVVADYHERYPKPCMHGWGARQLTVAPNGDVLPCPAASVITTLPVENVLRRSLSDIWYQSESFNTFRGDGWMREPCRTCARRSVDFGGCRCQAFLLTGDAAATDPVCSLSPDRGVVDGILAADSDVDAPFVMRKPAAAR
jgi:pyrroloquinoline quinone biosynthesis protein E